MLYEGGRTSPVVYMNHSIGFVVVNCSASTFARTWLRNLGRANASHGFWDGRLGASENGRYSLVDGGRILPHLKRAR